LSAGSERNVKLLTVISKRHPPEIKIRRLKTFFLAPDREFFQVLDQLVPIL
jgi:hypothetical protein